MPDERALLILYELLSGALPRRFRGFDRAATKRLLERAARTIQQLCDRIDHLERMVQEYQERKEALGAALMTAQRTAEELLASAQAEGAQVLAQAEADAEQTRTEGRAAAQDLHSQAAHYYAAFQDDAVHLHRSLRDLHTRFETLMRVTLREIESLGSDAEELLGIDEAAQLLDDLSPKEGRARDPVNLPSAVHTEQGAVDEGHA